MAKKINAEELMTKARQDDDGLLDALEGVVILDGVAGSSDGPAGGACQAFVVISEEGTAEFAPALSAKAAKLVEGEVVLKFVRAKV